MSSPVRRTSQEQRTERGASPTNNNLLHELPVTPTYIGPGVGHFPAVKIEQEMTMIPAKEITMRPWSVFTSMINLRALKLSALGKDVQYVQ